MIYFQVEKDFEKTESSGSGGFQICTLINHAGTDVTDRIDVGLIFQDDDHLLRYLSTVFGTPQNQIELDEI